MAPRTGVLTTDAPAPSSHLSQAIIHNGTVYCSGSFGMDPQTRQLAEGPYHQTAGALKNLDAILNKAGTSLHNALKVTIFILNMDHYAEVNKAYLEFFTSDPKPSRTCVAVAQLPLKGAHVEMEAIAAIPEKSIPDQLARVVQQLNLRASAYPQRSTGSLVEPSMLTGETAIKSTPAGYSRGGDACATAIINVTDQLSIIWSPYFLDSNDEPRYTRAMALLLAFAVLEICVCFSLKFILGKASKKIIAKYERTGRVPTLIAL
ncbi:endoribonuclease L-PSP [Fusarium circinatum]|uniref:Endoribonuclease L-PSP n=1 Tax=Fusarium circinatum TaxID=48490 RepID=A0A8H5X269_FUSCI|nr:endoribonuclease L-PSP [Fusarium circinatum]